MSRKKALKPPWPLTLLSRGPRIREENLLSGDASSSTTPIRKTKLQMGEASEGKGKRRRRAKEKRMAANLSFARNIGGEVSTKTVGGKIRLEKKTPANLLREGESKNGRGRKEVSTCAPIVEEEEKGEGIFCWHQIGNGNVKRWGIFVRVKTSPPP